MSLQPEITRKTALNLFIEYEERIENHVKMSRYAFSFGDYKAALGQLAKARVLISCIAHSRFINHVAYCDMFAEDLHWLAQEVESSVNDIIRIIEPGCV